MMSSNPESPQVHTGPIHHNCNCTPRPSTLNRRNFLRLGGLAGVTMLAAASLVACSNTAEVAPVAAQAADETGSDETFRSAEQAGSNNPGQTGNVPPPTINPFIAAPPNLTTWLNQHTN